MRNTDRMTKQTQPYSADENEDKLTNIHEALNEATFESRANEPMINVSVRLQENTKMVAMQICAHNGTDLSTFLRKCAEALVKDYSGF